MRVSLVLLVVAVSVCISDAQYPGLFRQGRFFNFDNRGFPRFRSPFRNMRTPVRLFRVIPANIQYHKEPAGVLKQDPLATFSSYQEIPASDYSFSGMRDSGHQPLTTYGYPSVTNIDALPLETDGQTTLQPLIDDTIATEDSSASEGLPEGIGEGANTEQPHVVKATEGFEEVSITEQTYIYPHEYILKTSGSLGLSLEQNIHRPNITTNEQVHGVGINDNQSNKRVPVNLEVVNAVNENSAALIKSATTPNANVQGHANKFNFNIIGSNLAPNQDIDYSANVRTPFLKSGSNIGGTGDYKSEQAEWDAFFENVRVIQTIQPASFKKHELQNDDKKADDQLLKDVAESILLTTSDKDQNAYQQALQNINKSPFGQRQPFQEPQNIQDVLNSELITPVLVAPVETSSVEVISNRASPSILIQQLKDNFPHRDNQVTLVPPVVSRPIVLSQAAVPDQLLGSSDGSAVFSVPKISGLYSTPAWDTPAEAEVSSAVEDLPLEDHRFGQASANVGVAVLPQAIPTEPRKAHKGYRFSYSLDDQHSGTSFSRYEQSDGLLTAGRYRVLLPDGRTQVVQFYDDGLGYQADVAYV